MLSFYLSLLDTEEERSKFEKLYYQYSKLMKYIATDLLHNDVNAEDAVHEAFIKLTRHLDKIDEIDCHKTKAFIVIVIRNICFDIIEREKKNKLVSLDAVENNISKYEDILEEVNIEEIYSKIKELPDIHRDIIELKVYHGASDKAIADILGISHQAVRKRIQRARNALSKLLDE